MAESTIVPFANMKSLLVLSAVIVSVSAVALPSIAGPYNYHQRYGIPAAEAIRTAEAAQDASRIVGGQLAPHAFITYQMGIVIVLSSDGTSMCGASLLTNTKSLTAAHCWSDGVNHALQFNIVLGSVRLFGTDGTRITSSDVQMHPEWNINFIVNDIAVINHEYVVYNNDIQPIALPTGIELQNDFAGERAIASGFGLTGNVPSPVGEQMLSFVDLPIISNAVCQQTWGSFVRDSNICTDGDRFKNICTGDSGGPLAVNRNGKPMLVGVVSYGAASCENDLPAGYARVTYYIDWILSLL